jgi:hypothetical protein
MKDLIEAGLSVGALLRDLSEKNSKEVERAYQTQVNEVAFETKQAFERHAAKQGKTNEELAHEISLRVQHREVALLFRMLGEQAARATHRERMRMLAAAFAGVLSVDFDAEVRSRVARAVDQLEPSDVISLRQAGISGELPGLRKGSALIAIRPELRYSLDALLAAGCASSEASQREVHDGISASKLHPVRTSAKISELGRAVLAALQEWTPEGAEAKSPNGEPQ